MESQKITKKDLFTAIWDQKVEFLLVFFGVMTLTYGILFSLDFIPEPIEEVVEEQMATPEKDKVITKIETVGEPEVLLPLDVTPNRIFIDKLDKEITVLNPAGRSIAVLDEALLDGVVRHPDSADFENEGTMFLFGHSSYLPNVINKNFQAFNGIQELTWGDRIRVQSENMEYVYRVEKVYQVKASDAEVEIERGVAKLTLATCNTFGSKDDRYIVESKLIDSYPIQG